MNLEIPEEVLSRELDGEVVLLDLRSGRYFGLNPTGALVWELAKAQVPVEDMAARLVDEFDVSMDRARADVDAFVRILVERGLASMAEARV